MKFILPLLLFFFQNADAQKRGDPKTWYWTVWFKPTSYPADFDSTAKGHSWVQSFFDPWEATNYYLKLKSTGEVLIWKQYLSKVDTTSVYIDSFNLITRKYSSEH